MTRQAPKEKGTPAWFQALRALRPRNHLDRRPNYIPAAYIASGI